MESFTKKITSLFDYDKEKVEINPNIVWLFILASFALSLILVLWFGISLFLRIENATFFNETTGELRRVPSITIDKEKLMETIALYEKRRTTQNERKSTRLWVEDPSF